MDTGIVVEFFKNYGWQLGLLALSGIVVLGFLKKVGVFKKLNANYKKYVYFVLSCFFSIVSCLIYVLVVHSFEWVPFLTLCGGIIALTLVVYGIYENTGLRALWNKIFDLLLVGLKKLFVLIFVHKVNEKQVKKFLVEYGQEATATLIAEVNKEIEENKKVEQPKV